MDDKKAVDFHLKRLTILKAALIRQFRRVLHSEKMWLNDARQALGINDKIEAMHNWINYVKYCKIRRMLQTNIKYSLVQNLLFEVEKTLSKYRTMLTYHRDRLKWYVFVGIVMNVKASRRKRKMTSKAQQLTL